MTNHSAVTFDCVENIGVLTMQLPPHNLLGKELADALRAGLTRTRDEGCRAVVLRSALRNFCAGADLKIFGAGQHGLEEELDPLGLLLAFEELPIPVIASVHGVALGGGLEVALACDYVIAAESSKMGLVEATIGLHPLLGGIQRIIDRAGVLRAKEMAMLAGRHDAATLERWNVINRVVPDGELGDVTMAIAKDLASGPTIAHSCTKRLASVHLREGLMASDRQMHDLEKPIWESHDLEIGLKAFSAKRPGRVVFEGR
jgi:enoyl-CoA hydratase/carnithine racemase